MIRINTKLLMGMDLYDAHVPEFFQTSTTVSFRAINENIQKSPHVKQSEKKFLNPDSDPDQQNSAKLFKSHHKEAL